MKTSNEPSPPGIIEMTPATEATTNIGKTAAKSNGRRKAQPIRRKNSAQLPHSRLEPRINRSSRDQVRSLKNSPSLKRVKRNSPGKYRPPPSSQNQYPRNGVPILNPNTITKATQQANDSPANRNRAIFEMA